MVVMAVQAVLEWHVGQEQRLVIHTHTYRHRNMMYNFIHRRWESYMWKDKNNLGGREKKPSGANIISLDSVSVLFVSLAEPIFFPYIDFDAIVTCMDWMEEHPPFFLLPIQRPNGHNMVRKYPLALHMFHPYGLFTVMLTQFIFVSPYSVISRSISM